MFLDFNDPFTYPIITCLPGVTRRLVIFNGTNCTLWRPDNEYGCFWDASAQAFRGPGCVPADKLSCGALLLLLFLADCFSPLVFSSALHQACFGEAREEVAADITLSPRLTFFSPRGSPQRVFTSR